MRPRLIAALVAALLLVAALAQAETYKKFNGTRKGKWSLYTGAVSAGGAFATHALEGNIFDTRDDGHYGYNDTGAAFGADTGDSFTLCARIHMHQDQVSQMILMGVTEPNATANNNYENGVAVIFNGSDDLQLRSYDNDSAFAAFGSWDGLSSYNNIGATNFPYDEYTTICLVYDGSADVADMYTNGVLATRSNVVAHVTLDNGVRTPWILDNRGSTLAPYGYVSHFGLWNAELTAAQIAGLDAGGNFDWRDANGDYNANGDLAHFYSATAGTYTNFRTDLVGSLDLTGGDDIPVDGQMAEIGSEELDSTP